MEYAELAFVEYARSQAMRARALLERHRREWTDCCRDCGRPHPCELRRYAGELLVYFDQWLPVSMERELPGADVDPAPVDNSGSGDQDSIHGST